MPKKRLIIILAITFFVLVSSSAIIKFTVFRSKPHVINSNISSIKATPMPSPSLSPSPSPVPSVVKNVTPKQTSVWPVVLSLDQASSLTVVVNKKHQLPSNYAPFDLVEVPGGLLRSDAAKAYIQIRDAAYAINNSFSIKVISSYRSYQTQASTYNGYAARDGQALADTYSARPGFSEHQTGLAVDIGLVSGSCALQSCFGDTDVGRWFAANAAKYGFIVRYPKGKDAITGYQYEPWHLRYLGTEIARAVEASGKTLDEFYTMPAGGYQ